MQTKGSRVSAYVHCEMQHYWQESKNCQDCTNDMVFQSADAGTVRGDWWD